MTKEVDSRLKISGMTEKYYIRGRRPLITPKKEKREKTKEKDHK